MDAIKRGENSHGPTFVAKCIGLYHHFLKIPVAFLEETAKKFGLEIGPNLPPDTAAKPENAFAEFEF